MKRVLISICFVAALLPAGANTISTITQADKDRAAEIVSKMTLQEKCMLPL